SAAHPPGPLGERRGATLVMVALSLVVLLGMGALAVDLAAAFSWRTEAQKIADSSALAGGSAYLDLPVDEAEPVARARAHEYALLHTIKGEPVDSSEVTVEVIPAERKVRVHILRQDMPTWFARVLGIDAVDIGATAAAVAADAGAARCLKPLALPDMWEERNPAEDANGNNVWDPGEEWVFDPDVDHYQKLRDFENPQLDETGYGSDSGLRTDVDRDFGRQIQLKSADPNDPFNFAPGIFFPWRLPSDPATEECGQGGGGGQDAGGAVYRNNICSCNNSLITLDTPYDVEPGNMVGPTAQGIGDLMDQDPDAYWDPRLGPVRDVDGETVPALSSPRVMKIGLFRPDEIVSSGMQTIRFNNFALLFLEGQANPQAPVIARFMFFAGGEGVTGPATGSLVRFLRLVE
ncbi:MAG: Tad domain-containing protein, partial [Longimicrobiales bacterium]|nr:Tad domain-containing protein [Longimicrobiales bacterium]